MNQSSSSLDFVFPLCRQQQFTGNAIGELDGFDLSNIKFLSWGNQSPIIDQLLVSVGGDRDDLRNWHAMLSDSNDLALFHFLYDLGSVLLQLSYSHAVLHVLQCSTFIDSRLI